VADVPDAEVLAQVPPAELAQAVAWRTARFGARQGGKALRRLPGVSRQVRGLLPPGPIARMAARGYSIWSADSRFCIASVRSLGSAWSVWSLLSAGSAGSLFSFGSIFSVGSAGSILSIGSAGSILSIGSAGSICAIGGAGQLRLPTLPADTVIDVDGHDHDDLAAPELGDADLADRMPGTGPATRPTGLSIIDRGGTLVGVLALVGALLGRR
jgi:hypothetical protein